MLCYVLFLLLFLSEKKAYRLKKSDLENSLSPHSIVFEGFWWNHGSGCIELWHQHESPSTWSAKAWNWRSLVLLWVLFTKTSIKKKIKNFWISVMCQWLLKTFVAEHIYLQVYIQVLSNSFGCCLNWNTTLWFFTSAVTTCEAAGKRKSNLPAWSQWQVLRHTVHKYRTYYLN